MGTYATAAEVTAALARWTALQLPSGAALEALIVEAEGAVDARLGPLLPSAITGRKVDPALLTAGQRAALTAATALAVGHLSELEMEQALGLDDFVPDSLRPLRGAGLGARIDETLSGHNLLARSGCALPDPPDDLVA